MDIKEIRMEAMKLGYSIAYGKKSPSQSYSTLPQYREHITVEEVIEEANKIIEFVEA